jgi:hypothetical protein
MAFYFSSETKAFYDTDVFPVASLPANKVEINEATYTELLTKQNQGYVILADGSGNPYAVTQGEASATDIKHAASVATTVALGHVKVGNTMKTDANGVLDVKEGAVTSTLIADGAVTTTKIADGSVTEEKLESVKDLAADETSLTLSETSSEFTLSIKDGGVTTEKIADGAVTREKIAPAAIGATRLATDSVQTDKIQAAAVTTVKIADANVTNAKIADGAVTTAKIADANVTNAKIADDAITLLKLAPNIRQTILTFLDLNGNNLNGQDVTYTFQYANEKFFVGYIPFARNNSLVDFTLEFEFAIPQQTISNDIEFSLIVYERADSGSGLGITIDSRSVKVTPNSPFVRERFSFSADAVHSFDDKIKIDFQISGTFSAVLMRNVQLRGFGIM